MLARGLYRTAITPSIGDSVRIALEFHPYGGIQQSSANSTSCTRLDSSNFKTIFRKKNVLVDFGFLFYDLPPKWMKYRGSMLTRTCREVSIHSSTLRNFTQLKGCPNFDINSVSDIELETTPWISIDSNGSTIMTRDESPPLNL